MFDATAPETSPADDIDAIYALIKDDLAGQFDVSLDAVVTTGYRPESRLDRDMLGQWQQHLLDLGYLEESEATAERYTPEVIGAIEAFCADDPFIDRPSQPLDPESRDVHSTLDIPVESFGAGELDRLEQWTAFDGLAMEVTLPDQGEQNLASRVLHFRLKTLGLYRKAVDRPVNEHTTAALESLERTVGPLSDSVDVIDLLGDPSRLGDKFVGQLVHEPLVFRNPSDRSEADVGYRQLAVVDGRFVSGKREWRVLEHRDPAVYRQLQEQLEDRTTPAARRMAAPNTFGLELIQLQLWKHGFYKGRVDGWWGPQTVEALREALAFEGIDPEKAILSLGEGYFALNFSLLHERLFAQLERAESSMKGCQNYIMQESVYLGDRGPEHRGVFRRVLDGVKESFQEVIAAGRRIYRGAKTLVKSAANALLKGFNWIRGELKELAAPVVNFLRLCWTSIRDGIRTAAQAVQKFIHFVVGRPLAVHDGTHVVTAHFDFDSDAALITSEEAAPRLVERHLRLMRSLARALEVSLVAAARVVRYLASIAAGPPAWIRIAFEIGTIIRNALRNPTPALR